MFESRLGTLIEGPPRPDIMVQNRFKTTVVVSEEAWKQRQTDTGSRCFQQAEGIGCAKDDVRVSHRSVFCAGQFDG